MYSWVHKYIGIPFVSGGRDFNGCDCYGLVRLIFLNEYKYNFPLLSVDYDNALCIAETKKLFSQNVPILCAEKIAEPEEKAVALMRTKGSLCHVGVYAGDGFIIHSRHNIGAVCERFTNPMLASCVEGWYRVNPSYSISESVFSGKNRI